MTITLWSTLPFGKHAGKSLPQVLLSDPDWFFWAVDHQIFRGALASEAQELARKARHIRIPKPDPENWRVEYIVGADRLFRGFEIVQANNADLGSHRTHLDLSFPRTLRAYDKLGCKLMLQHFRNYFGRRWTRARCEAFFGDNKNFA